MVSLVKVTVGLEKVNVKSDDTVLLWQRAIYFASK